MIFELLLATFPVGVILLVSEFLWRKKIVKGERARKFIHILAGVWMAFWPFYLPFDGIFLLGTFSLVLLLYSRFTNLFHAIYAVKRTTYGEIFFAVGIMTCAFIAKDAWIFTTAILLLALADGGAAVVGRFWGIGNQYNVFGSKELLKSWAGTAAFIILAYVAVLLGVLVGGNSTFQDNPHVFLFLPVLLSAVENVSPFGFDNFATPLLATIILNSLLY